MCLIFLSVNNHPRYQLVIAANRDEFHKRQTAPADFWQDAPTVLAGRDLEANGTWLGVSTSGKISLLTNYRDPHNINPQAPSRGKLVSDFLTNELRGDAYLSDVEKRGKQYNGFNLLAGTAEKMWYHSNYAVGIQELSPGVHGLSNHLLDTPWPKVERGKKLFSSIVQSSLIAPMELFEFLYDDKQAPDNQLPDTGVGLQRERALSAMFIKSPDYGSRSSTVLLVDKRGRVIFSERVYDLKTFEFTTRVFEFEIESRNQ
ncbi:MAG: NRDE family protein [Cyclobacteriaceae bacterium]|nr:NRDE family protein [Cyclobacteriaceae bacterium]